MAEGVQKNFMSDPSSKQGEPKEEQSGQTPQDLSTDLLKGTSSEGAIRFLPRDFKDRYVQSCSACGRVMTQMDQKHLLNSSGHTEYLCFGCYLVTLKANTHGGKHKDQLNWNRTESLQSLGLQGCTKHPTGHSIGSFTYCSSCDLVQCSLCLLSTPHRKHQIYPLNAALNTAKKLRDFVVTQMQDQEHSLEECSGKKLSEADTKRDGRLLATFEKVWAPLASAFQQKELQLRTEITQMEMMMDKQKAELESRRDGLVAGFKKLKKEFKHLNGLELLKSTLCRAELSSELSRGFNTEPSTVTGCEYGMSTPRTVSETLMFEPNEEDVEVLYQKQLKDWRHSSQLGRKCSQILEEIDSSRVKLTEEEKFQQKAHSSLRLKGLEEVVTSIERLGLNVKQSQPDGGQPIIKHKSRASLPSQKESTNNLIWPSRTLFHEIQPNLGAKYPETGQFLLDVLDLQKSDLGRCISTSGEPQTIGETPSSCYLSKPKLLTLESPIFSDSNQAMAARKSNQPHQKQDPKLPQASFNYSGFSGPLAPNFHPSQVTLQPTSTPYTFGRPSELSCPMRTTKAPETQGLSGRVAPLDTRPFPESLKPPLPHPAQTKPSQQQATKKVTQPSPGAQTGQPVPNPVKNPRQSTSPAQQSVHGDRKTTAPPSSKENPPPVRVLNKTRGRDSQVDQTNRGK